MKILTYILSAITGFMVTGMGLAAILIATETSRFVIFIPAVVVGVFVTIANAKELFAQAKKGNKVSG